MGIEYPKCQTDNPSDSKFCKEYATPLPSSEDISVSPTKTIETPVKEFTRGSTFAGKLEIIRTINVSFKAECPSPSKNHTFFIIQRNL